MAQKPITVRLLEDEFVCECDYLGNSDRYEDTYAHYLEEHLAKQQKKVKRLEVQLERRPRAKA